MIIGACGVDFVSFSPDLSQPAIRPISSLKKMGEVDFPRVVTKVLEYQGPAIARNDKDNINALLRTCCTIFHRSSDGQMRLPRLCRREKKVTWAHTMGPHVRLYLLIRIIPPYLSRIMTPQTRADKLGQCLQEKSSVCGGA